MRAVTRLLLFALVGALIFAGCDSNPAGPTEEEPGPGEDEVVLADNAVVVDSTELSLAERSDSALTFDVLGSASEIESGDVIVGTEGGGFLRRVTRVEEQGATLTLTTENATITDGVLQGRLDVQFPFFGEKGKGKGWRVEGQVPGVEISGDGTVDLNNTVIYDGEAGNGTDLEVVIPEGQIKFTPTLELEKEIDDDETRVKYLRIEASGQLDFDADVEVTASGQLDYSFEKEAVPPIKKTVIHFIGPWPVVEVYRLSFMVGVETGAQAAGTVETGVESENSVTVGGEYRNQSWSPIIDGRREFRQKPVEWGAEGEASARVYVRPAIEVFLYGVVGPQVDAEPYLDWRGQTNPPMWMWSLNGGADAHLQMKWQKLHERVAFYEKEFTLIDEVEIASGEGRSELGLEEIGSVNFGDDINDVSIIDGGEKAVVPVNAESSVEVVDLSSESVLESLSVQGAARVAIGPGEQFAYIGRGGFGKISRVNLETYEVAEAQGEGAFGGLAVSPDGNEIYASAGGENSAEFRIIDASSLQITNRVPMQESGDLSAGMDIGPGGNAAYVSTGGATRGDFLKIDLSDGGKETLLPEHAGRVAVTPDGNQVWISGSFAGGRVISTETGEILSGDIGSGSDVAISPDGAVAYLASGDKIIAYSTNTFEQIGSLVIQGGARAVAVSQSGEKLCVGTSEGLSIVEVRR